jgi:uncharacterized membrane protein
MVVEALITLLLMIPVAASLLNLQSPIIGSLSISVLLIWPGYVVASNLWPKTLKVLDIHRFVFAPFLSILLVAFVSIGEVLLGISSPIAISVTIFVIVVALLYFAKKIQQFLADDFKQTFLFFIILSAIAFTVSSINSSELKSFSEFYLVSSKQPTIINFTASQATVGLQVGINNHEGRPVTYRILVKSDGEKLASVEQISIDNKDAVIVPLRFQILSSNLPRKITLELYRTVDSKPYLYLQVPLSSK